MWTLWWCYTKHQGTRVRIYPLGTIYLCHGSLFQQIFQSGPKLLTSQSTVRLTLDFIIINRQRHNKYCQKDISRTDKSRKKNRSGEGQPLKKAQLHSLDCTCFCQHMKAEARWFLCMRKTRLSLSLPSPIQLHVSVCVSPCPLTCCFAVIRVLDVYEVELVSLHGVGRLITYSETHLKEVAKYGNGRIGYWF